MTGGGLSSPKERACNTSYTSIARRMKMICAALQAPRAHQRAHQRAHHFPKDVRYIGNGAHTILPAAHIILPGRAHHFASSQARKPFCFEAQSIFDCCPSQEKREAIMPRCDN